MQKKFRFRNPFLYKLLFWYVALLHRLYYKRYTVHGLEKIPAGVPLIFAPNHQNALMDALAVLYMQYKPVVFMARADIFRKPAIAAVLNFLKILPIYRIRDGFSELARNKEVFDNTVQILRSGLPLCILPEGNHEGSKRLRQLKKGVFRIAFQAEENAAYNLNLHIVPVGIDYSDYFNAGSNLIINIGEPIRVEDFLADYRENEQKTINQLMNKLRDGLENVMVHIPEKQYGSLLQICELYASAKQVQAAGKPSHYRYFLTVKELGKKLGAAIEQSPDKVESVIRTADEWQSATTSAGLAGQKTIVTAPKTGNLLLQLLLALFALPFFMAGSAGNILPYLLASKLGSNAKDPHFKSSIKFGAGLFIFPIYYVILILITSLIFNNWLIATALITGLAALGIFAYYMRQFYLKLLTQLKIMRLKKRDHLAYNSIVKLQAELLNGVEAILKTTESR